MVGHEEVPWALDGSIPASRAARRRHLGPYCAAVIDPIARRELHLPGEVLALAEDPAAEIARCGPLRKQNCCP